MHLLTEKPPHQPRKACCSRTISTGVWQFGKRSIIYLERLKIADESNSAYILETCGIREHAIDILDGGKEAFEKRKTSTRYNS
jgi:hypothetical protein